MTRTLTIDTSLHALRHSGGQSQILLHAGRRPDNPESAAILTTVERARIEHAVAGMHLVVILAGLGGTAGSGLTPLVAAIAHQQGIVTVVVAVMPSEWESPSRTSAALASCETLLTGRRVDALFQFSNDAHAHSCGGDAKLLSVFDHARTQFVSLYRNLVMPIAKQGFVGFDLDDLRYILSRPGLSACAEAMSRTDDNSEGTCAAAISKLGLSENGLGSASAVLVNIECARDTGALKCFADVSRFMREQCDDDAELFFTMAQCEIPCAPFRISVLATGIKT